MPEITDLIQLCRFAGERFDLVQSTAGNASLKVGDTLWIKASRVALSDVSSESDLCELQQRPLLEFLADNADADENTPTAELDEAAKECIAAANRTKSTRPSNETFLHALLGTLTLHTHPPVVTSIVCQRGWKEKISTQIPEALFVDYYTPGARLALALSETLKSSGWEPGNRGQPWPARSCAVLRDERVFLNLPDE